jgi:hypothetical protein
VRLSVFRDGEIFCISSEYAASFCLWFKFTHVQDPGTGIQPFLTPVPPVGSELLVKVYLPFGYLIGAIRTLFVLALGLVYTLFVSASFVLLLIPPVHRIVTFAFTALISRLILLLLGLWWIPVETVTRKRGCVL